MESDCLLKFCSLGSSLDYQSCLETFLGADSNVFSASLTLVGHIFLEADTVSPLHRNLFPSASMFVSPICS